MEKMNVVIGVLGFNAEFCRNFGYVKKIQVIESVEFTPPAEMEVEFPNVSVFKVPIVNSLSYNLIQEINPVDTIIMMDINDSVSQSVLTSMVKRMLKAQKKFDAGAFIISIKADQGVANQPRAMFGLGFDFTQMPPRPIKNIAVIEEDLFITQKGDN
jgi:hypothetical protein